MFEGHALLLIIDCLISNCKEHLLERRVSIIVEDEVWQWVSIAVSNQNCNEFADEEESR